MICSTHNDIDDAAIVIRTTYRRWYQRGYSAWPLRECMWFHMLMNDGYDGYAYAGVVDDG